MLEKIIKVIHGFEKERSPSRQRSGLSLHWLLSVGKLSDILPFFVVVVFELAVKLLFNVESRFKQRG